MSTRRRTALGSVVLTFGEAVVYGCSFVRNMLLARMLTKADFGIAASFAMIITLLEFTAKLGIAGSVIRDPEGDRSEFVATAHLVQFTAGIVSALLIVSAASPLARLFDIAQHVGAIFVLAVIPLLNGCVHLDVRRLEREFRFAPSTAVEMIPQVAITLAAWPVAKWYGDYRAIVALLLVKALCTCVGSHWLAQRPYRWGLNKEYAVRMLEFGWPMLVTGFLMFGVLQGDQFLVATFYSMTDLGPYAAAAALTMAPSFFFGRVFSSIALPVMASVQRDPATFERRYRVVVAGLSVFSVAYSVAMIIGAEALMTVVYGQKYAGSGIVLGWLAASNTFRNVRVAPAIAASARGDSVNHMMSNLARVVALIPALAVALAGQPTWLIASAGLVGEAAACAVSFGRLSKHHHVPLARSLGPTALVAVAVVLAGALSLSGLQRLPAALALAVAGSGAVVAGAAVLLLLPDSRREAFRLRDHLRSRGWAGLVQALRG